ERLAARDALHQRRGYDRAAVAVRDDAVILVLRLQLPEQLEQARSGFAPCHLAVQRTPDERNDLEVAAVAADEFAGVLFEGAAALPPLQLGVLIDGKGVRHATDVRERTVHGNDRCHVPPPPVNARIVRAAVSPA